MRVSINSSVQTEGLQNVAFRIKDNSYSNKMELHYFQILLIDVTF